eukprot:GGOE01009177.1.p3 GENE.GGOE01009177.1~~GGOE01009177.1.p3  ORF type:complete len:120 (-),score=2.43 GGOE01009177.1:276-635(-)
MAGEWGSRGLASEKQAKEEGDATRRNEDSIERKSPKEPKPQEETWERCSGRREITDAKNLTGLQRLTRLAENSQVCPEGRPKRKATGRKDALRCGRMLEAKPVLCGAVPKSPQVELSRG